MRQTKKVEGTKIAQAAKDLNVTSVTVRRYISEFNIQTATDKNGIKVLPDIGMDELKEVRRLKEDGLTNPQVLEALEDQRSKPAKKTRAKKEEKEEKPRSRAKAKDKDKDKEPEKGKDKDSEKDKDKEKSKEKPKSRTKSESTKSTTRRGKKVSVDEETEEAPAAPKSRRRSRKAEEEEEEEEEEESEEVEEGDEPEASEGRLKHSLTCQTCGKTFEHLNPRLRDCLDCYRSKRKERRRGGDRHKNVIQHPLAQQVVNKMASQQQSRESRDSRDSRETVNDRPRQTREQAPQTQPKAVAHAQSVTQPIIGGLKTKVRSYRKAIDETRHITSSLKRRLERPDLPEGDRRWLEQIYAYQLILHQGWRHLSEYRSNTQQQAKKED